MLRSTQLSAQTPSAADMRELRTDLTTMFQAMKDGDVAAIEQHCSGPMLAEYKTLFEQNQEYPAFLRNFYKGATFSIGSVKPRPDGEMTVEAIIELGGGSKSITRLNVKRFEGSSPKWKVTDVVRDARTTNHPE
jgi:hypothetical protein